jgi:hypothetical protein
MLTTIATYSFPYEAQIAKARLDAEGIPAFVADEQTINMQWLYSNAMGGVRLQVPEQFAVQAADILAEDHSEELEQELGVDSICCSACGSDNTEPYQIGKRWAFLVFLGLDFPLFPVKNTYRCKDCGFIEKEGS